VRGNCIDGGINYFHHKWGPVPPAPGEPWRDLCANCGEIRQVLGVVVVPPEKEPEKCNMFERYGHHAWVGNGEGSLDTCNIGTCTATRPYSGAPSTCDHVWRFKRYQGVMTLRCEECSVRHEECSLECPDQCTTCEVAMNAIDCRPASEQGVKHDDSKARYDLIPPEAIEGLAHLYALGAEKYGDRNWEEGLAFGRVFAAMMRHAWAWWRGEDYDKDGHHHLLSVAWGAFTLFTFQMRKTETDGRVKCNPPKWFHKKGKGDD